VCSVVPASAETAPGTLTVSVVVIDRCVISNALATSEVVKCSAAAPPHRITNEVKPFAGAVGGVGRTIIF
jgi:hypothetical protein